MSTTSSTEASKGSSAAGSSLYSTGRLHRSLNDTAVGGDGEVHDALNSSSPPDMLSGVCGALQATADPPLNYQTNTNAYDSAYAAMPLDSREEMLCSSGSFLDSRKDSYHPIKMHLSGGGGSGGASFTSGNWLSPMGGDGGFLKSVVSLRSSSFPMSWKTHTPLTVDTAVEGHEEAGAASAQSEGDSEEPQPFPAEAAEAAEGPDAAEEERSVFPRSGSERDTVYVRHPFPRSILTPTGTGITTAQTTGLANAPAIDSGRHAPSRPAKRVRLLIEDAMGPAGTVDSASDRGAAPRGSKSGCSPLQPPQEAKPPVWPPHIAAFATPRALVVASSSSTSPSSSDAPLSGNDRDDSGSPGARSSAAKSSHSSSSGSSRRDATPPSLAGDTNALLRSGTLPEFDPLIAQHDFDKRDVKEIACTAEFTCVDLVARQTVTLAPIRLAFLERYEPVKAIRERLRRAGRVRARREHRNTRKAPDDAAQPCGDVKRNRATSSTTPGPVTTMDFPVSPVAYEGFLLALSLSLYGSVLFYDDVYRAALDHFLANLREQRQQQKGEGTSSGTDAGGGSGTDRDSNFHETARLSTALPAFLGWLNKLGVDVLLMTADRRAASSFCAKRRDVKRSNRARAEPDPQGARDVDSVSSGADRPDAREKHHFIDRAPLHRVLVALEYDTKLQVWGPVVTSRPIHAVAAAQRRRRRRQRREATRRKRRAAKLKEREDAAKEAAAAIAAKWAAWQAKQRSWALADADAGLLALPGEDYKREEVQVCDVAVSVDTRDEGVGQADEELAKQPFYHMRYPTLVQTDCGCGVVLAQSTNRKLGRIRLKLMVGAPLGFLATCVGIALLVFASRTLTWCAFADARDRCIAENEAQVDLANRDNTTCVYTMYATTFDSSPVNRFLFGKPLASGNAVIVAVCCMFVSVVASILFVFFITRFLATGSVRAIFFYVVQLAHVLLACVACAFAAFSVSIFSRSTYPLRCSSLNHVDEQLCQSRLAFCGAGFSFRVIQTGRPHVALALSVVFLALCGLEAVVALIPALPSAQVRMTFPRSQPQTYAFQPSPFAPDGMSPAQVTALQRELRPNLRRQLRTDVLDHERLLTRNITIGEMMQANREQSLRKMELTKAKEGRQRASAGRAADGARDHAMSATAKKHKRVHYMAFPSESDPSGAAPDDLMDDVVLSPALLSEVKAISRRVRRRRGEASPPQTSAGTPGSPALPSPSRQSSSATPTSPRLPTSTRARTATDSPAAVVSSPVFPAGAEADFVRADGGRRADNHSPFSPLRSGGSEGGAAGLLQRVHSFRGTRRQRSNMGRTPSPAGGGSNPFSAVGRANVERQRDRVLREKEPAIASIVSRLRGLPEDTSEQAPDARPVLS